MIKEVVSALRSQLQAYSTLIYANNSGYEDADVEELIQLNKYPFYNILGMAEKISPIEGLSFLQLERHVIQIKIQFATRASTLLISKQGDSTRKGIYAFADDIMAGIKSDRTLGGVVQGMQPASEVSIDVVDVDMPGEKHFIAGAELTVFFFKDLEA